MKDPWGRPNPKENGTGTIGVNQSDICSMYGNTVVEGMRVRVGVGVVVRGTGETILLEKRRDCGWWGLPGGKIEPGESIIDAAVREVL